MPFNLSPSRGFDTSARARFTNKACRINSRGIVSLIQRFTAGDDCVEPIHFVSGQATTLGELAALAIEIASSSSSVVTAPPRNFDVARFYGTHQRATTTLNWTPRVPLRDGLAKLIADFQPEASLPTSTLTTA